MKFKLLMTSLYLIAFHTNDSHATNLNRIYSDTDAYEMGFAQPHMINEKLLFNGQVNNEPMIWAMDAVTREKQVLFNGHALKNGNQEYFKYFNGHAYFSGRNEENNNWTIWKTDGTQDGTVEVFDTETSIGLYVNNGFLFTKSADYKLLVSDGMNIVKHDVTVRNMNSTCIMAIDNVVVQSGSEQSSPYQPYKHSSQGVVNTLDITINLPVEVYLPQITSQGGACFTTGNDGAETWKINASGEMSSLNTVLNNATVSQLISHQNNLYAVAFGPQSRTVKRFSQDLTTIDAIYGDPQSQHISIREIRSLGEYLAISVSTPTISPSQPYITFTDSDLLEVEGASISFENLPTAHQTLDDLVLQFYGNSPYILINPFDEESIKLNIESANSHVISDTEGSHLFIKTRQDSGQYQLLQVKDTPDIDLITTGSWYDVNVHNQGLNIRKGTRQNGSEYISVTGYTFKDGVPFWFAGDAALSVPTTTLNVDVYEFSGISMFEPNNTPEHLLFGSLELKMNSCQQMTAKITTSDQSFILNLHRLDDVTFTENCVD